MTKIKMIGHNYSDSLYQNTCGNGASATVKYERNQSPQRVFPSLLPTSWETMIYHGGSSKSTLSIMEETELYTMSSV